MGLLSGVVKGITRVTAREGAELVAREATQTAAREGVSKAAIETMTRDELMHFAGAAEREAASAATRTTTAEAERAAAAHVAERTTEIANRGRNVRDTLLGASALTTAGAGAYAVIAPVNRGLEISQQVPQALGEFGAGFSHTLDGFYHKLEGMAAHVPGKGDIDAAVAAAQNGAHSITSTVAAPVVTIAVILLGGVITYETYRFFR